MSLEREPVIASYGIGTNSTAYLIEMVKRGEPVDAILSSDTGGERRGTYEYLEYFSDWLVGQGYPGVTVVRHLLRDGTFQSLYDECITKGTLPSIAFGFKKCSGKFKLEPQAKWTNHWQVARDAWKRRVRVVKLIGFGIDEQRRADKGNAYQSEEWFSRYAAGESAIGIARAALGPGADLNQLRNMSRRVHECVRYRKRYPLIEYGMDRDACIDTIRSVGLRQPGKSSCFYCPSLKKKEIAALSPEEQGLSLAMEANARPNLTSVKGLGRNFAWSDFLSGLPVIQPTGELPCECTDGDDD